MRFSKDKTTCRLQNGKTGACFLESGDIHSLQQNDILINQFLGNVRDGGAGRLYLKLSHDGGIQTWELTGSRSESVFGMTEHTACFRGTAGSVAYEVRISVPREGLLIWRVDLEGEAREAELVFGQDLALATTEGTLTNELYISQYLGYEVFDGKNGLVLGARQNMSQGGRLPAAELGTLDIRAVKYSTDAMQFFGKSYKETDIPKTVTEELENSRYQYEMSYAAIQTEKFPLQGRKTLGFYLQVTEDHPEVLTGIWGEPEAGWEQAGAWDETPEHWSRCALSPEIGTVLASSGAPGDLLDRLYPTRRMEEYLDGRMLSFFPGEHTHVVLKEKELLVERPHAHILITNPSMEEIDNEILASTNYMYGVFQSQLVVGNTSMHKMLSVSRGLLNQFKTSGQRIYVKLEGRYRLLTMPAIYEMGLNYSRWYYRIREDLLQITVSCCYGRPDSCLEIRSMEGRKYELLITNQLVLGEYENSRDIEAEITDDGYLLRCDHRAYPDLTFRVRLCGASWEIRDDGCFYADGKARDGSVLVIRTGAAECFRVLTQGRLREEENFGPELSFRESAEAYHNCYRSFMGAFHMEHSDPQVEKLNEMLWWYVHDALIHYISPHGVEQPGGAAWGTRDVCQGPFEFFLSTGNRTLMKKLILNVFSHQFLESGEWPQWFMFDRYEKVMQFDCHGDVVFWPLKMVGDYLTATGDRDILSAAVPYHSMADGSVTGVQESILAHIERAWESIRSRFVGNTHLITYAGGDWDDTLQPASEELKQSLVSTWTVALACQVIGKLAKVLPGSDFRDALGRAAEKMGEDFRRLAVRDGVIPGFLKTEDGGFTSLLHPEDRETGIHYRLLPMTRSILAGLVSEEQAEKNMKIIHDRLLCPDGVRLMDRPAVYTGGNPRVFRRADQAANVGREIGLMYTHAHIRYIEALAALGRAEEAWQALAVINPIGMEQVVPNAQPRQCNCYYSSSDGAYPDRYAFQQHPELVYQGKIPVRGGWRVYSSGSGICIHQIISALIGLRREEGSIILDPVLPQSLDGLRVSLDLMGKKTEFLFHNSGEHRYRVLRNGEELPAALRRGTYRMEGVCLGTPGETAGNRYEIYI